MHHTHSLVDCDLQVKVVPNFSTVNVYWLSTGYKEDEIIETLLKEHEGLLRYGHSHWWFCCCCCYFFFSDWIG